MIGGRGATLAAHKRQSMFSHNGGLLSLALASELRNCWVGETTIARFCCRKGQCHPPAPPAMMALGRGKPLNPGVSTFTPPPCGGRLSHPWRDGAARCLAGSSRRGKTRLQVGLGKVIACLRFPPSCGKDRADGPEELKECEPPLPPRW